MRERRFCPYTGVHERRSGGWILLEVIVAITIAGLLTGPLAGALLSSMALASRSRDRAASVAGLSTFGDDAAAWQWGSRVLDVRWLAAPSLQVEMVVGGDATELDAGVWLDGWYVGAWPVDRNGGVSVERELWEGREGGEVVVRARTDTAGWGPPWRLIVPGPDGEPVPEPFPSTGGEGAVVLHAPAAATPEVVVSWEAQPLLPELPAAVVLPVALVGTVSAVVDGAEQTWRMEAGRDLDVYF